MYQNTDDTFHKIYQDPTTAIQFAIARSYAPGSEIVLEKGEVTEETPPSTTGSTTEESMSQPPQGQKADSKIRLSTNFHVVIYDSKGQVFNPDQFSGLSDLKLDKDDLESIKEVTVETPFGGQEDYRYMTIELTSEDLGEYASLDIKYAVIYSNVSQIKSSIASYESTVALVMISFWLISIVASIYLANVSMRPLLVSFQKQKDFVENASHELRTPLAVLQNRLESLFRHPEATIMESSENIASSLEEVRNMRLLTTNLLNLARRDDGLKPEISDIPPSFFDEVFANYAIMAEESGKELQVNNEVKQSIRTDRVLLKQLMTILFDNALKYSDEDGQIHIDSRIKDRYLVFTIADNGLGIRAEDKKKIFDRFYRVDKARTRQKGGFGLGLSLAKQIIDTLDGSIQVRDNHPKGTIFEVRLPR